MQKKMKKWFLTYWNSPHQWEKNLRQEEKENFIRKRVLTSKREKNQNKIL